MIRTKSARKLTVFGAALFVAAAILASPAVLASGAIGGASAGVSQYGQMYKLGKVVFFRKLACSRTECPIKRDQVNGDLAAGLVDSLRTRDELKLEETENDAIISLLCPGTNAVDCAGHPDEQAMVEHYLGRRFRIGK